ncbi:MAG: hypothetical protein WCV92_03335 [Candidatus Buchananbacteria bacterium]
MKGNKSVKISVKQRLFLASIIVILAAAGVLLFILNYSNLGSGDKQNNSPADQNKAIDILVNSYKQEYQLLLGGYLELDPNSSAFLNSTQELKSKLLELKVPGIYREKHQTTIFTINRIETLISVGQIEKSKIELNNLKRLAESF